jgi:hypothetical protein
LPVSTVSDGLDVGVAEDVGTACSTVAGGAEDGGLALAADPPVAGESARTIGESLGA